MAIVLDLDDRGRITIPKEWRKNLFLKRVVAIQSKNGIYLIPVSDDPLKVLKGAFTTTKITKELKKEALELALEEAKVNKSNQEE